MKFAGFSEKVWLSSPTMHGPELKYVTEAYETNWMSTVGANINELERIACEKQDVNTVLRYLQELLRCIWL